VSLIALLLVLANQVAEIFGYNITIYNEQVTAISETILSILALLGIIVDPTTDGLSDSNQALSYIKPKDDKK
jgi:phi LC3 family holin